MNFTLKDYFYKLYNRSMLMMLLPIAEFLGIYYLILSGVLLPIVYDEILIIILLILLPIVVLSMLTIVQLEVNKRLKKISEEQSLGRKLDLYFPLAKRKINSLVGVSFLLGVGFFFTTDERFSIYFGGIILWCAWQWPSPRKVARDLKLKGDEREMVISRGDSFPGY
ncbi:MAG TPA: hypothetical protein VL728_05155 [Cyclobacteriaceae bacterium]|jgi:hypothetical protein|nr:hypothetical protein [Cyclobacteriaceae bacterium]